MQSGTDPTDNNIKFEVFGHNLFKTFCCNGGESNRAVSRSVEGVWLSRAQLLLWKSSKHEA